MITDDYGNQVSPPRPKTINERLETGDVRMAAIEVDLAANTKATQDLAARVQEILDFFDAMKGGLKVLGWLGKLAKPLTALVALGLALWSAYLAYRNGFGGGR